MRNALLIINEEAHIRELTRVVDLLLRTQALRPVIFLEDRMKPHARGLAALTKRGVEVLTSDSFPASESGATFLPKMRRGRRWRADVLVLGARVIARCAPDWLRRTKSGLIDVDYIDLNRNLMLRRATVCDAVLRQRDYAAIVLCEDNVQLDTAVWITVARRHNVRSVIVPYTISNTAEFAESYVHHTPYQVEATQENRIVARLFPEWTLTYKGRHFLRSNYAKTIAVEQLGLTPTNPWLLNSGHADAIAVESAAMYEYYCDAGIPACQLVPTGSLTDDVIAAVLPDAEAKRRSLLRELGLPEDRPLLLSALPPDQNTYNRPGCEFTDFDDLIGFWGACLAGVAGWNVVVRPHPKTAPDRLSALRRQGIPITEADTAGLIPLCDLYVASVSATIRWAIACGKPVINYDVYQYDYKDYAGVEGVALVNTRTQFRDLLQRLTGDPEVRATMTAAQRLVATRWAWLDGKSSARLLALLRGEKVASEIPCAAAASSAAP